MAEKAIAPTTIFDPIVKGWAEEAGIRTAELSTIIGGNVIGGLVGVPLDMFLTQLGSKVMSFFIGAAGLLFGTYNMKGYGRAQTDTMQISARIFTEFLDPSPDDVKAIQRQIGAFIDGMLEGRWDKVAYAFVRSPRDFEGLLPPPSSKKKATEKKDVTPSKPKKTDQPTYPKGPEIIHKL